eukprot:TRINITY_DN6586_c0_g1_i13.p1 TRINITY_DN6586_c0_g1~~TRINITY_DN6586_c0_g1_i13.p1  ORF type:complete len:365 (+),score=105.41 TRINITY_DN6586_c0_g1_i13:145-1095(+)
MGFAGAYLIFASKNIRDLILQFSNCSGTLSEPVLIIIMMPFLIPTMWIRQLSKFTISIFTADFLIVAGIMYLYIRNMVTIGQHGVGEHIHQFDSVGFWPFLGTALYALEGTAFVLPIEHAMREQDQFGRVTTISGLAVGFMYMTFGCIGYLAFGSHTETVITLNLRHANPHDYSVFALQIGYVLALLLAYPVTMFPAVKIVEAKIYKDQKSTSITWRKNALRAGMAIFTALAAIGGGSSFDNFISLIGGLACVPLTLVYPAYFHHKICGDELKRKDKLLNYFILFVGIFGTVACTIVSIWQWISAPAPEADTCIKM